MRGDEAVGGIRARCRHIRRQRGLMMRGGEAGDADFVADVAGEIGGVDDGRPLRSHQQAQRQTSQVSAPGRARDGGE